jgi:hypothetical protein
VHFAFLTLMSLIFKNDARFNKACHYVALFQAVDTPVNGHPSLFRIDSVRWRLLFPTLCWSINTNSMPETLSIKRNRIKIRWVVLKI